MSLNWDLGKIENYNELCYEIAKCDSPMWGVRKGQKALNPITNALIWQTMAVGISHISEKNWKEFYTRLRMLEKVSGAMLNQCDDDGNSSERPLTAKDVRDHIGLSTNASLISKTQFMKRMYARIEESASYRIRKLEKEEQEANEQAS